MTGVSGRSSMRSPLLSFGVLQNHRNTCSRLTYPEAHVLFDEQWYSHGTLDARSDSVPNSVVGPFVFQLDPRHRQEVIRVQRISHTMNWVTVVCIVKVVFLSPIRLGTQLSAIRGGVRHSTPYPPQHSQLHPVIFPSVVLHSAHPVHFSCAPAQTVI